MDKSKSEQQTQLESNKTRTGISVYRNLSRSWNFKPNNYTKNNGIRQRYNNYKYLLTVITLLFASPSYAETVGGVSATAAPVANSSGSVTNQAIQVLQGPYITNTYGGGIQCQGPTLNFTPYVTGAVSAQKPFEDFYNDPVYDLRDLDEDGSLDNPGDILYRVPIRTGQKDNYSLSLGFSATWSKPLDAKLQEQCKQAAATQKGIYFHPKSPYYSVCADIIVTNPGGVIPQHRHSIPTPISKKAEDLGGVISTSP